MIEAAILGLTRYRTGSTPIVYSASICSEIAKDPDLRGHAGAGPRRDHDGREDRPHFPHKGEGNGRPEGPYGAKLDQGVEKLQAEHHTGEKTHQHNNKGRLGTDIIDLVHDLPELFSPEDIDKRKGKEDGYCT